jgi:hypothetical protein
MIPSSACQQWPPDETARAKPIAVSGDQNLHHAWGHHPRFLCGRRSLCSELVSKICPLPVARVDAFGMIGSSGDEVRGNYCMGLSGAFWLQCLIKRDQPVATCFAQYGAKDTAHWQITDHSLFDFRLIHLMLDTSSLAEYPVRAQAERQLFLKHRNNARPGIGRFF